MAHLMERLAGPLGDEMSGLVEAVRRGVVVVCSRDGHGAGVVWDANGLIVTNDHVAPGSGAVPLELADGRRLTAKVVGRDRENDLALLQVDRRDLPQERLSAVPVGDSAAVRVGEIVLAVGHPRGIRGTVTFGIVSVAGVGAWLGRARRDLLQADIALAPGSSGGPLVNTRGEVVGIASMTLSPGIALAIPVRVVKAFVGTQARSAGRRAA